MDGLINYAYITRNNSVTISSILDYVNALPLGTVDVAHFYTAPSDAPSGLGNWQYTMVTYKALASSGERDYILLFYPTALYMGNVANNALTWKQVTLT